MHDLRLGHQGRNSKPRMTGLTAIMDPGLPRAAFADLIHSHHPFIDAVKFGWGTALVTDALAEKISILKDHAIAFWFGGTLFERAYIENQLSNYIGWVRRTGAAYFEVSDGTIHIPAAVRRQVIKDLATEFLVLAETGKKDSAVTPAPKAWVDTIHSDLEAGARWIILEGRESGTNGIYEPSGQVRGELIETILSSAISVDDLFFEAPRKDQQTYFIRGLGASVNLANISPNDAISLETLRRGLRSDTLIALSTLSNETQPIRKAS